ncbi:LuxR C-terminal-related transcriptional regulator [Streptomyces naphthomycinicus]|uniref:LuxR C-terminal-related transcriptional regulator n=1 Tax=Streptomyces naphthomycinicus TaxID=2872625 RepID=UPI001CEDD446|nr:LuxR C-terminal-related transcriptional regulator [Streptomyces sp. TML10]
MTRENELAALMSEVSHEVDKHTPEIAIAWYRHAARQSGGDPFAVQLALARACLNAGRHAECARALRIGDTMTVDDEDPVRRTRLAMVRARMARLRGHRTGAVEVLNGALDEVVGIDPALAARLQVQRAAVAAPGGWPGIGQVWADSAVHATAAGPDLLLHMHALAVQAMARLSGGDTAGGGEAAAACARLVDALTPDEAAQRPSTLLVLGWSELLLEEDDAAVRHLSRCLSLVDRWQWELAAAARSGLAELCLRHGRYAEAAVHVERALWLARKSGALETTASALALLCRLESSTADTVSHVGELDEALRALPADNAVLLTARLAVLETRLAESGSEGEAEGAAAGFVERCGGARLPLLAAPYHPPAYAALTRAALATDDRQTALAWAKQAGRAAKWLGITGRTAIAQTALAECAPTAEERLRHATDALAAAEEADHLPTVAQAYTLIARERLRQGAGSAAEPLTRADDLATLMGARRMTRRIAALRAESAEPDASSVPPPAPALGELTPREREVAVLVSRGRTNRQIARELGLSHKTVETHLSRIFSKFEVSSRAAVAARVGHGTLAG